MLKDSGKYPCSVSRKGAGSKSICCTGCLHWNHKECGGIIGRLKLNPDYDCSRCKGAAHKIDGKPTIEWLFVHDKNWILLIHFVTLDIQLVLEVVVILVLSQEFDLHGASFANSCQY